MIIAQRPKTSNTKPSEAQKAQRERFAQAIAYSKAALADPDLRVQYEERAATQNKRPKDLAVSDYFKGRNLLDR